MIAGNVATGEATEALIKAGADAVKVGIDRVQYAQPESLLLLGVPQRSAILD